MSIWPDTLRDAAPLPEIGKVPSYAAVFFWRNSGPFRALFVWLTLCSIAAAILNFCSVAILAEVISNSTSLQTHDVFFHYLPLYAAAVGGKELLDYVTRKYGEAFPTAFSEFTLLRFFGSLLQVSSKRLFGISKERLYTLLTRYIGNVEAFLRDWFWGASRRVTELILVLCILYRQSPYVCLLNLAYMAGFLWLSFSISRRFAPIAMEFSKTSTASAARYTNFFLLLNSVRRLGRRMFFTGALQEVSAERLTSLDSVRSFHARRWLIQLSLFDVLYAGTLFFGVYQILQQTLPLGFLLLLRYAFTQLWEILVYAIEYYVRIISERQDAVLLRDELEKAEIRQIASGSSETVSLKGFTQLQLKDISLSFADTQFQNSFTLRVPEFHLAARERVGIIGRSGSGKSTFLQVLLQVLPANGSICIDEVELGDKEIESEGIAFISSYDPLFNLTLKDNVLLGREISEEKLQQVLDGVCIVQDTWNLDQSVGTAQLSLSSGEAQRIRLARGLLQDAELFIFDEPLNGIDVDTKKKILQFLESYLCGKTVILVTHDEAELAWMQKVYRMEAGILQ